MAIRTDTNACWPLEQWPEVDRNAWVLGCSPNDPYEDDTPHYAATLRADSVIKIRKGYGRWLCFLAAHGWLDPSQPPLARITRGRLCAYVRALREAGNADYTIIGRFSELECAMRIMAPGQNVSWIRRPKGPTVYASLRKSKRSLLVPDTGVLYAWAIGLMDEAGCHPATHEGRIAWRDGLLLAVFAARARRLRPMAALRVGHELVKSEDRYRIELPRELVKTDEPDRFSLPRELTPYVRHYLDVVRPALLQGRMHDALWVNDKGEPWTAKGIQHRVIKRTRARFGIGFGPHRFRHAIGTTTPMRDPAHPGVGAVVMGISRGVLDKHYDRSGQSMAARLMDRTLAQRSRRLQEQCQRDRAVRIRRSLVRSGGSPSASGSAPPPDRP